MNEFPTSGQYAIPTLSNIGVAEKAVSRLNNRGPLEPGLVVFCGPSGYGKSMAAALIAARYRAYYVEATKFWTKKTMLQAICVAMGLMVKGTVSDLAYAITDELSKSRRILIIDEFDFLVEKNLVDEVRSLHDGSKASILLIGEEMLPQRLARWERFHGRILDWFFAARISMEDARALAKQRCSDIAIANDLLEHVIKVSNGSARRVSNNIGLIYQEAVSNAWPHVDLSVWGGRELQTGAAPRRSEPQKGKK